jgi:hypothetical protein
VTNQASPAAAAVGATAPVRKEIVSLPAVDNRAAMFAWAAEEIKQGPARMYDLAKFGATVATATGGAFVTYYASRGFYIGKALGGAAVLHLGAVLAAVWVAWPRRWVAGGETDLYAEYARQHDRAQRGLRFWLAMWLGGLLSASLALLLHGG